MLETYTIPATAIAYASGKSMLGIFNAAASVKMIKVWRIWVLNNGTAAVTGVLTTFQLQLSTAQSAGSAITPVKHDSANAAIDANVAIASGATVTDGNLLRQILYSNDEAIASGATQDEWELLVPLNCVWDSGYGDSNIQPITLRSSDQGFHVKHSGTSAVGSCDIFAEITQEAE